LAVADDAQLVKLAAYRARDLFPILNRTRALTPLLVLFAILPGLSALTQYDFGEQGALWGLKSLEAYSSTELTQLVDPNQTGPASVMKSHPPLGSWLSAAVMSVISPSSPLSFTLVPFLSSAGLVVMCYFLFQKLCGSRIGFLTALLLAFHGPFLEMIKTPSPFALSLFLAAVSFWGVVRHLQDSKAIVSFPLLIGGIALGLCFLSGGPLALFVIAVLLTYIALIQKRVTNGKSDQTMVRRRNWSGWIAIRSICLALMTAFAVGGWWFLMMWSCDGGPFLTGWFSSILQGDILSSHQSVSGIPTSFPGFVTHRVISLLGLLVGLSLFGFGRAALDLFRTQDEQRRHSCAFLIAWTGIAALIMLGLLWETKGSVFHLTLCWEFLLVPLVALAAFALDEIACRRVGVRVVAAILFFTIASLAGKPLLAEIENGNIQSVAWSLLILISLATLIIWEVGLICRENDSRQRFVIGGVIIVLLLLNAVSGLRSFHKENPQSQVLTALRNRLASEPNSEFNTTTLITQNNQSARLRLIIRSLLPNCEVHIVPGWDVAMTQVIPDRSSPAHKQLIVDWKPREKRMTTPSIPGLELKEIILSQNVHQNQLRAYIVSNAIEDPQK